MANDFKVENELCDMLWQNGHGYAGEQFYHSVAFQSFTHTNSSRILSASIHYSNTIGKSLNYLHRSQRSIPRNGIKTHRKINIAHSNVGSFLLVVSFFSPIIFFCKYSRKQKKHSQMTFGSCLSFTKPKILEIFSRSAFYLSGSQNNRFQYSATFTRIEHELGRLINEMIKTR